MDQTSADMQTKTQEPHNQKNNENGPKHVKPPVLICEHLNSETDRAGGLGVYIPRLESCLNLLG